MRSTASKRPPAPRTRPSLRSVDLTADSEFIKARTTTVPLGDDLVVTVRPIVPGDRDELAAALQRVSEESQFLRFFRTVDHLSDRELEYLTEIDYDDHFAWVAFTGDPPSGLGVARYIRVVGQPDVAEAAVLVVDEYQRRGIGTVLLQLLAESAMTNGITSFRGYAHPENRAVLDAAGRAGVHRVEEDGIARLDVRLPPPTGLAGSPMHDLLRHAAAGEVDFRSSGGRSPHQPG